MKKPLLITFIVIAVIWQANAQSVGLVLSGGGAKGLAHIGLIRELEKNNIPIDYICGTSIGAIIGGLYAAGYTPDEMEALFRSDDFYFWSTGKIQKEYRYYFKQQETDPTWLELRLAKKDKKIKILPPTNIIPAEQMDFAFMELTAGTDAACNYNFNNLMVPYFCVATDINNNKPVILRKGDLGNAMRASMTVPLYFKPITINDTLLFDGGILNNFPTDFMKKIFNPDIIIGHKVADENKEADADDLMQQISNMVMRPTNFEIDKDEGILLETKLDNTGLLDFDKIDSTIVKGERTAQKSIDSIKGLIKRRVSAKEIQEKRDSFNSKKPELLFQNIQVEGVKDPMQRKFIIKSIKHNSDTFPLSTLKTEYFKLVADDHLKSIQPLTNYNPESGYFDLHLKVEPEKHMDISIGGNLSTKPINQGFAAFNYRAYNDRAYSLSSNLYFGRFYSSFKIGARIDYPTTKPLYIESYFTLNRWDYYSSSSELFFEDVHPPYIIKEESNLRIEGGFPIGYHNKLYAGIAYSSATNEYYEANSFQKEDTPDNSIFNAFVSKIGIESNSLNYKQYATEGTSSGLEMRYIVGKETYDPGSTSAISYSTDNNHNYWQLNAHYLHYGRLSRKIILGTQLETSLSNKDLFYDYKSTKLSAPGFSPSPHSKSLFISDFHSNNYIAGGLHAVYNITSDFHFRVEGYCFLPIKEELEQDDYSVIKTDDLLGNYYWQGLAAFVYQTGIGPVSMSLNYYERSNTKLYFTLNFGYILFNKRGL
jgi:NTE family protein